MAVGGELVAQFHYGHTTWLKYQEKFDIWCHPDVEPLMEEKEQVHPVEAARATEASARRQDQVEPGGEGADKG